jgi:hypothetical protein
MKFVLLFSLAAVAIQARHHNDKPFNDDATHTTTHISSEHAEDGHGRGDKMRNPDGAQLGGAHQRDEQRGHQSNKKHQPGGKSNGDGAQTSPADAARGGVAQAVTGGRASVADKPQPRDVGPMNGTMPQRPPMNGTRTPLPPMNATVPPRPPMNGTRGSAFVTLPAFNGTANGQFVRGGPLERNARGPTGK